ncbi:MULTISPECIES: hypothetical protein [Streptococcus]|jgi:hypothetical protein|nr:MULTISPECIES: hypothetical protein [Streptococcus]KYF36949.1 hypothetical protein SMIM3IV_01004 [Streptococcus mitis]MBT2164316.1 hypothetical protein [Streptococcus mitis]MDU1404607.1 hypothetical protein [Streptococcus mitis]OFN90888.1 hypothetical protein HMPREF2701_07460 [Streptococcus sp. HMSC077D04]OXT13795.1 hypothetical protein CBI42_03980 [Streptococcus sp. KR]
MENPWKNTTSEIYNGEEIIVATADLKYIKKLLNSKKYPPVDKVDDDAKGKTKKAAKEKYKLRLNVYPQHFVGDIDNAKIIILSLNPGYSTEYYDAYKNITNKNGTNYEQIIKENLEMKQPFFHAFELANESDLGYWGNKMKCWVEGYDKKDNEELIESLKKITEDIALAEFFPYHSISYNGMYDKLGKGTSPNSNRKIKDYLPTQKFLFEKIKKRIDDKNDEVIIILTRSFAKWYEAIEGLRDYKHCYEVNNTRNFSLNPAQIYKVHRDSVEDELKGIILK